MPKQAFFKAICPHVDTIRGIREVFYKHKPFADNSNPVRLARRPPAFWAPHVAMADGRPKPKWTSGTALR